MRFLLIAVMLVTACSHAAAPAPAPQLSADLDHARGPAIELRRLTPRVWIHDSVAEREPYGAVHANGLVVVGRDGAVVVDSAWTPQQTRWLLEQVRAATGKPALALVATHFHDDRAGGASVAGAAGVPVYASSRTRDLLGDAGAAIDRPFDTTASIELGDDRIELFFPGAGHTRDNIVVYLEGERLLFGGCLVRAGESSWIGYTADADLDAWPATMDRVIARFPEVTTVVPGHGAAGGPALLPHTRALAKVALSGSGHDQVR